MWKRWEGLPGLQRTVVVLLLAAILGFRVAYSTYARQQGITATYQGAFLRYERVGEEDRYTGKPDGAELTITRTADGAVCTQWGKVSHGPYTVTEDPSARPEGHNDLFCMGVELREGENVVFRGGWHHSGGAGYLIHENGTAYSAGYYVGTVNGHRVSGPQWEISLNTVMRVWDGPELVRRGAEVVWWLATLLALVGVAEVLYADDLFRWRLSWRIKDPEEAEPSEWELAGRSIGAVLITGMVLAMYCWGLNLR